MKKQMLFALLALTANQASAHKKTGEVAKDEAPALCYLVPMPSHLRNLEKHTDIPMYITPDIDSMRLNAQPALSVLEHTALLSKLDAVLKKLDSLPEPK